MIRRLAIPALVVLLAGCADHVAPLDAEAPPPPAMREIHQTETGSAQYGLVSACFVIPPAGGLLWRYSGGALDPDGVDHVKWRLVEDSDGLPFEFVHDGSRFARFGFMLGPNASPWIFGDVRPGQTLTGRIPERASWAVFWSCEEDGVTGTFTSFKVQDPDDGETEDE